MRYRTRAGSLLALVSYPILVEPLFGSSRQAYGWSLAYVVFAVLCGAVTFRMLRFSTRGEFRKSSAAGNCRSASRLDGAVAMGRFGRLSLRLLLAITNHLSQNIAPIPLLWVVPLSLYLLSLVLCFDSDRWYARGFWLRLWLVAIGVMIYALFPEYANTNVKILIPVFLAGLFCCCMVCHGELASRKPAPAWITSFYLMLSVGGALGGMFVALLAPAIFALLWSSPLPCWRAPSWSPTPPGAADT